MNVRIGFVVCGSLMLLSTSHGGSRDNSADERRIVINGESVGRDDATDRVVTLLRSRNSAKEDLARKILAQNAHRLKNGDDMFSERLINALADYHTNQPAYPPGLRITEENSKELFTSTRTVSLCFLALYGGKKGEAILTKMQSSSHPVEKKIAEGVRGMLMMNRVGDKAQRKQVEGSETFGLASIPM